MSKTALKQLAQEGASTGQALVWNSTSAKWVPGATPVATLTTFGGTPNANAGNITAGVLQLSPADGSNPGGVSTGDQTFAGIKTFANIVSPTVYNTNGTGASDICVKVGTSQAAGSVNATAKLFSVGSGVGGTYGEYFSITKNLITGATLAGAGASDVCCKFGSSVLDATVNFAAKLFNIKTGIGGTEIDYVSVTKAGLVTKGDTNAAGNYTTAYFAGVAVVLLGSASTTITNASFTATSRILITWLGDSGAARSWVQRAAGYFIVTLSSAATTATSFSWEVSSLA